MQTITIDTSIEAKCIIVSDTTKEVVWLKIFIEDVGIVPMISDHIPLLWNSNDGIVQEEELTSHHKSKIILRCTSSIRKNIVTWYLLVTKVPSTKNIFDPLMKTCSRNFERHCITVGLMHKGDWLYSKGEIDVYYVANKPNHTSTSRLFQENLFICILLWCSKWSPWAYPMAKWIMMWP